MLQSMGSQSQTRLSEYTELNLFLPSFFSHLTFSALALIFSPACLDLPLVATSRYSGIAQPLFVSFLPSCCRRHPKPLPSRAFET